jgi:hypothetical protein
MIYDANYVVQSCLADTDSDATHYKKYLKWAIDGFKRMNMSNATSVVKSVLLDVRPDHSALLPDDYVDYTKIGIEHCGQVLNLNSNPNIFLGNSASPPPNCAKTDNDITCDCNNFLNGQLGGDYFLGTSYWQYMSFWHNGQFTAGYYGVGAGYGAGTYRLDLDNRKICLGSCIVAKKLVLEYIGTGIDATGNFTIPYESIEALRAYVHWQKHRFSGNNIAAREEKRRFQMECAALVHKKNAMTAAEWMELIRESFYQTPKR